MWLSLLLLGAGVVTPRQNPLLDRLSEEAEVFKHRITRALSQETLVQHALQPPSRFHLRAGRAAVAPPQPRFLTREIVSEYTLGTLQSAPGLHEFRQVVSVDGRHIASNEKARHALVLGVQSSDDKLRQRMLEQFRKFGLQNAAVEFAPAILMFTRRQIGDYTFRPAGTALIGADDCDVLDYEQVAGQESMLVLRGRQATREPLRGRVYLRRSDHLPLRITFTARRREGAHTFQDDAVVDYTYNPQGFLMPVSAVHREQADGALVVESTFQYTRFREFGANTDIHFQTAPPAQ